MKIYFLGTNGWYSTPTGDTPCILVDSKDHYVIFDAGNGIYKIDRYIKKDKPICLFISHFHIDHISGLHILNKFNFKQRIDIYIAKGRKKDFETFVNPPYTIGITNCKENIPNLKTEIRLHELEVGDNNIGFPVQMEELYHAYGDHGFRVTLEEKNIVYSGDTGIGPNSFLLSKNADLLIHECSNFISLEKSLGHVDPIQVATFARDAKVKRLALTHFGANTYVDLEMRKEAEKKAKEIFPNTIAARDGLVLEV